MNNDLEQTPIKDNDRDLERKLLAILYFEDFETIKKNLTKINNDNIFNSLSYKRLYKVFKNIVEDNKQIDLTSIKIYYEKNNYPYELPIISTLTTDSPADTNFNDVLDKLKKMSSRREFKKLGEALYNKATFDKDFNTNEIGEETQQQIEQIQTRNSSKSFEVYTVQDLAEYETYLKNINENDFYTSKVFLKSSGEGVIYKPGNIGFIGARTSRGKTTALISVGMDALLQGKKIYLATMEESPRQILTRFITSILYNLETIADFNLHTQINQIKNVFNTDLKSVLQSVNFNARREIENILGDKETSNYFFGDKNELFKNLVHISKDYLNNYIKSGKLKIFDGLNAPSYEVFRDSLRDNDKNTICILDYIQKVKTPKKYEMSDNRFSILKAVSEDLATITKQNDLIFISGGQFGRDGNKTEAERPDRFTDESFQECSSIEQVGEIEIGIGRQFVNNKKQSYYAILKDRENGNYDPSQYFALRGVENFSNFETMKDNDGKKPLCVKLESKKTKKENEDDDKQQNIEIKKDNNMKNFNYGGN